MIICTNFECRAWSCCLVVSNSFATPWTIACQAPLCMGLPKLEYWSGLPFPSPGFLPDPGIELASPALAHRIFITEPPEKPTELGSMCMFIYNIYTYICIYTHTHIHVYIHTYTHTHTPINCQIDGGYRNLQHSILFPCTSFQEISSHQPNTMNHVIQNNFTYSSSLYTRDHKMCTLLSAISIIHTMPLRYILVIEHSSKLNIDCSI